MQNNNPDIINLPLLECIRRSFTFAIKNLKHLSFICLSWFGIVIFEIISGFPFLQSLQEENESILGIASALLLLAASLSLLVSTCRIVIDKFKPTPWYIHFAKAELKVFGYSLILSGVMALLWAILFVTIGVLLKMPENSYTFTYLVPVALGYIVFTYIARYYLIYPAKAIGNNDFKLQKSFALTKGNANKLAIGIILSSMPFMILSQVFVFLYIFMDVDSFIGKTLITTCLTICSFGDSILKASFYAHAYQYFIFFDKQAKEDVKNDD